MDVPKGFKPKKDKLEELESPDWKLKKKDWSLKDLILTTEFPSISHHYITTSLFYQMYDPLKSEDIPEWFSIICGAWSTAKVDIFRFKDDVLLKKNIKNIAEVLNRQRDTYNNVDALVKEEYAIFIWTPAKGTQDYAPDPFIRDGVLKHYKKKFGFKEVKAD